MIRCKCWVKTYMMDRPTTSMKEGWLCRTSYDKKNHEIAHMMMTRDDPDLVMMTPRDPDPTVMIQIE